MLAALTAFLAPYRDQPAAEARHRMELAVGARRRARVAELGPAGAEGLRGRVVGRRLLDLLVRQLAPHAPVRGARGPSGIATTGSSSSACTRPSSGSSTTSATCAARFAIWASATRS